MQSEPLIEKVECLKWRRRPDSKKIITRQTVSFWGRCRGVDFPRRSVFPQKVIPDRHLSATWEIIKCYHNLTASFVAFFFYAVIKVWIRDGGKVASSDWRSWPESTQVLRILKQNLNAVTRAFKCFTRSALLNFKVKRSERRSKLRWPLKATPHRHLSNLGKKLTL